MPVTPPLRRPRQTITAHLGLHSEASLEAVRGTVQNSGDRAPLLLLLSLLAKVTCRICLLLRYSVRYV